MQEPCSNCKTFQELQEIEVGEQAEKLGFTRATRCPNCGDEVAMLRIRKKSRAFVTPFSRLPHSTSTSHVLE